MRIYLLLLWCLTGAVGGQTDPAELLAHVRRKVLDTVGRIPNLMCTQTVDRAQFEPNHGKSRHPCEPSPDRPTHLATSDRLRLDVGDAGGHEIYSWAGESRFEDRSLFALVRGGAISTGTFEAFLTLIFRDDHAVFSYVGKATEVGRRLVEFRFRVPVEVSHYVYKGLAGKVTTGYEGSLLVDPETFDLVRLVVRTVDLPGDSGACKVTSTLDYGRVRLNDADFLLPTRVRLNVLQATGTELDNTTVYSGCHEFLGESTLSFAPPAELEGTGMGKSGEAVDAFPAGIPFQVALTDTIDSRTAAAGDKFQAKLIAPIRGAGSKTLIPKGAGVTGRIIKLSRYYVPEFSVRSL